MHRHLSTDSTPASFTSVLRHFACLAALFLAGLAATACGAQSNEPLTIEPIAVPGPPASWDMASRLMNRQSASTATLAAGNGSGAAATFEKISASMYYNPGSDLPFTGTVTLRADSLSASDSSLQQQLEAWLEPARHPAFIYQTTGSQSLDGVIEADGNLLLRDRIYPATARWEITSPVGINDEGRRAGELRGTIVATVPGSPFSDDELRLVLTLPSVGYTAAFVEGVLTSKGIKISSLTGDSPSYPSAASDLSDVAWYLMLAGHPERALDVFQMSIDQSAEVNTYMRMADAYIFAGQYDQAVGTYVALEQYNLGHPHSLELLKMLGGSPLGVEELAAINTAWSDDK
jgi:hypothetical protein